MEFPEDVLLLAVDSKVKFHLQLCFCGDANTYFDKEGYEQPVARGCILNLSTGVCSRAQWIAQGPHSPLRTVQVMFGAGNLVEVCPFFLPFS